MKKGFTLVELLGVILILGLITMLAIPPLINRIKATKTTLSEATATLIKTSADLYVDNNKNAFPKINGNVFCLSLQKLSDEDYLTRDLKDITTNKPIDLTMFVKVTVTNDFYNYEVVDKCVEYKQ